MQLIIEMSKVRICIRCKSSETVKHGLTSKGVQRYRCLECNKTWTTEKEKNQNNQIAKISEQYLDGKTTRELAKLYPTSPVRINSLIRQYLSASPDWHDYIDKLIINHTPKQIYLSGKKFHCSWNDPQFNEMFVAFAMDSMTGFVLAFKVCFGESNDIWVDLLNNLKQRNITTYSFLTNGSEKSLNSVRQIFPTSDIRITYHKNYRDKELGCCLARISPESKLINDASRIYFSLYNNRLASQLGLNDEKMLRDYLFTKQSEFVEMLKQRLNFRTKQFNDNLPIIFQKRFEKFHLLKEDPNPIVNSWVANQMLCKDENGLSRLALYTQDYSKLQFKDFVSNQTKIRASSKPDDKVLNRLLIEVVVRCLELPLFSNECHFDFGKCALVV
jgi:hypothetical protein